ncbi:APC family permease [Streptomyces sp. A73]|uniref:APC family permease n=1 Tax=Streptomyces sp. RK75 TaxID=2824895 RepID=UPI0016092D88|nr:APC family permease [Streptomyces sp. RK75]MBQ0867303.1 APC family permease [Streptomyces sp. RK75]MBQ1156896.1 APC family permease [Streptomyces sp. A73]
MPSARSHTADILGGGPGGSLRRSLSLRDLIVYGLLFIAPMAPVGIYGALDARSHGVVPLVYVVATVAMSFTAYSYARMIHTVPQAGSVYAYARVGLGNGPGFVAGWMMMLDYLLIPAVAYLFSGIAMAQLVPEVDQWIWTAIAVVVTTALNLSGVRRAAVVGFLVLAMEILVLLVFVVAALVVLAQDGPQRGWLSPLTGDRAFSMTALLGAVSVAVLSFLGFDAIANFAEEAVGGKGNSARLVARALVWCLLVTGVLFVLQTYLAALLSQDSSRHLAENPAEQGAAFYTATESAIGGWLETTVAVSKAIGAAFAALAGQAAASRLLYAMARDRRLPRFLGSVGLRTGVPGRALLLSAVLTMGAAVWAARSADGLDRLVSIVDIGALFGFGMLHLSVMGYYGLGRRGGGRPAAESGQAGGGQAGGGQAQGRQAGGSTEGGAGGSAGSSAERHRMSVVWDWVVPLVGLAIVVAVIVTANREAHWVGLVWLVIALVALAVLRRRDKREAAAD